MSPSGRRTAKEVLHRSDLLWLTLLAYSKAASSNDSESSTTPVLSLFERLEVVGQRLVHDGQGESGELATVIQEALREEIPLI